MPNDKFNLPVNSLPELESVVQGYAELGQRATLDSLSRLTGKSRDQITRNNGFLAAVGLIDGGRVKTATPLCEKLGRALLHKQGTDGVRYWREVVEGNEFLSDQVSAVRLQGGMSLEELASQVLYASGQSPSVRSNTGARTTASLLVKSGLLSEDEGKVKVSVRPPPMAEEVEEAPNETVRPNGPDAESERVSTDAVAPRTPRGFPQLAINIQLHLPETEKAEVYENLFRALRENLLASDE